MSLGEQVQQTRAFAFAVKLSSVRRRCDALAPGRSNMVLTYSYDGRHWEAIEPNDSFIGFAPGSGAWDCCSVFGAKQDPQHTPEFLRGEPTFPLYYAGCNGATNGSCPVVAGADVVALV